jgi:hypothetical protein
MNGVLIAVMAVVGVVFLLDMGMHLGEWADARRCREVCREKHHAFSTWDFMQGCRCATPTWVKP